MIRQFLGSENKTSYQSAKVVILPIPYEATTTYRQGCQNGPAALLEASDQLEAYDEELERETCREVGIYTCPAIADTRHQAVSAQAMLQETTQTVTKLIEEGKWIIAVGGEHSITAGVVKAYQQALKQPFTVVQIDAHGDLRHQYEGSIYNHACVMRRIVELGLPTLAVGIRSICLEEAELIKAHQIPIIWAREMVDNTDWIEAAIARIPTEHVFITIDVDGIDPSLMPGVGTPEPGGLNWYALLQFLGRLFATRRVIGGDVMELAPLVDSVVSEFTAAKLVYKLIGYQASSQKWFES